MESLSWRSVGLDLNPIATTTLYKSNFEAYLGALQIRCLLMNLALAVRALKHCVSCGIQQRLCLCSGAEFGTGLRTLAIWCYQKASQ